MFGRIREAFADRRDDFYATLDGLAAIFVLLYIDALIEESRRRREIGGESE